MELEDFKKRIMNMLKEDDVDAVFELLEKYLNPSSKKHDDFILLSGELNHTRRYDYLGLEEDRVKNITARNKIIFRLQQFVNQLTQDDLLDQERSGRQHHWIYDKVLVIAHRSDEAHIQDIERFFYELKFRNAKAIFLEATDGSKRLNLDIYFPHNKVKEKSEATKYKESPIGVVIFDNTDLPDCPSISGANELIKTRVKLMEAFMEKTPYTFVHYGERIYWLNDKKIRTRFQAANSRFALYARVKEVLDFLTTINPRVSD